MTAVMVTGASCYAELAVFFPSSGCRLLKMKLKLVVVVAH